MPIQKPHHMFQEILSLYDLYACGKLYLNIGDDGYLNI